MTQEELKNAIQLDQKRKKIERELSLWNEQITKISKLAYLDHWHKNHPTHLESKISNGVFLVFRAEAIADLQHQLNRINDEMESL